MVLYRHASVEVIDHHRINIAQWKSLALGRFHHADTPVHIGREAILHVVGVGLGQVGARIERLVAHQHALAE